MKNIKLEINGKEYAKSKITFGDWVAMTDYIATYGERSVILDREAGEGAFRVVAEYLDIPYDEMIENASLDDIMDCFRGLQDNLREVFFGSAAVKAKAAAKAQTK